MVTKRYAFFLPLIILLLAFLVRFHLLGAQSLWHDEGNSVVQATRSLPDIASHAARDIHPPGYYWLLAVWRALTGESEFALRSLSTFASVLSVAFAFALGRVLSGRTAGVIAVLFVSLNTFSIYYAQEARMYALLALWSAASMWVLVGWMRAIGGGMVGTPHAASLRGIVWWGILLGCVNAAGLYTQYAYTFVMLAQGVLFGAWWVWTMFYPSHPAPLPQGERGEGITLRGQLLKGSEILGYYIAANVLTLLLFLPWLPTAWEQIATWPSTGDATPPAEALPAILGYLAFGITQPGGVTVAVAFFLLFGLLVPTPSTNPIPVDPSQQEASLVGAQRAVPLREQRFSHVGGSQTRPYNPARVSDFRSGGVLAEGIPPWWNMLLPVLWVVISVAAFLALGLYREANLKFLLPAQIGFALWLARGAWVLWTLPVKRTMSLLRLAPKLAAALGVALILSRLWAGLDPLYHDPAFQRDNYRAIAASITENPRPGDAIILNAPNQQEVFDYYYAGDAPVFPLPRGLGGDDAAALTETRAVINDYDRIFAVFWGTGERDPNNIVENTLDNHAFEAGSTWYGDVRLVRYFSPDDFNTVNESGAVFGESITLERYAISAEMPSPGDVLQVRLEWSTDAPLDIRYKVFVQLLAPDGFLVTQHDAEPGGGLFPTPAWTPGDVVLDNHALMIPNDLPQAHYTLIVGLYDLNNPQARLAVGDSDFVSLGQILVE